MASKNSSGKTKLQRTRRSSNINVVGAPIAPVLIQPIFTGHNIRLIQASLPSTANQNRLEMLPDILREWSKSELRQHLIPKSRAIVDNRNKRLATVGEAATRLAHALGALDRGDSALIAYAIAKNIGGEAEVKFNKSSIETFDLELEREMLFLPRLAVGAEGSFKTFLRGSPSNTTAYLVIQDLAAMFEYLTGRPATRRTDRDTGEGAGPFWDFSAAVWPVVFGQGDKGLGAAMKKRAAAQKKYDEASPLIANIDARKPSWRLFEL